MIVGGRALLVMAQAWQDYEDSVPLLPCSCVSLRIGKKVQVWLTKECKQLLDVSG